ncbi:hypothetical protein SAMN06298216_1691 [Spirosomataceae bacterium TFI 002]|nr:hypothetical protein SAMN06298216_1691 [Spirosomataceae bacterium TFI 002]
MKTNAKINTQPYFLQFCQNISLTLGRSKRLTTSKRNVEKKIKEHFTYHKLPRPDFFIQGSYKMKTMVIKSDGTYDVDLGVYFRRDNDLTPSTVQKHVYEAVNGITSIGAKRKNKCVRLIYKSYYNIDLPVYSTYDTEHPHLATKKGWEESDPKELCAWFDYKAKKHGSQLISLVKYFKAWANVTSGRMPSGIAFSVWVAENFIGHVRDDIAFYKTAVAIQNTFGRHPTCINPATPNDDFLEKLTPIQVVVFEDKFDKMISLAKTALEEKTEAKALATWKKIFGRNFYVNLF